MFPIWPTVCAWLRCSVLTSSSTNNNHWLKDGVEIADAIQQTYEPTDNAFYTVKVDFSGCSNTSLPQDIVTGIEGDLLALNIFPNPSNQSLEISGLNFDDLSTSINLVDMMGRTQSIHYKIHSNHINVDLADVPDGLYIVQLKTESGVHQQKIIKESKE